MTFRSSASDADGDVLTTRWAFCDETTAPETTPPGGGPLMVIDAFQRSGSGTYPVALTVDDGRGGTTTVRTSILLPEPALLRVVTNPPVPGKILVDGVPRDEWGLGWMKIAPGGYTVAFGEVYGYTSPTPIEASLQAGATTAVRVDYLAHGWLRVTTDPPVPATIFVDGVPRDDWGMWQSMPPGTYEVSFGEVRGFRPPAPQSVTVYAGETARVVGSYTVDPNARGPSGRFGLLRVTTDPPVSSKIFVDGVPRDEWGLSWLKLPPGNYEVSFSGTYGVTPLAPATVTVNDDATTEHVGRFLVHGSLRVLTDPPVPATIFVDGFPRNDWGMWQSMEPGTYVVSFGPALGYVAPLRQTVVVRSGEPTVVTGTYAPSSGG
jgi:hypothetical protein